MEQHLSAGSLIKIINGELTDEPIVVQYLGHKQLTGSRYRLFLSDGEVTSSYNVLSQQHNHLLIDGIVSRFAICRISKYLLAKAKAASSPVIVVLSMEVVVSGEEIGQQLGNPVIFEPRVKNPEPSNQGLERNNHNLERNNHDLEGNIHNLQSNNHGLQINSSDQTINYQNGTAEMPIPFSMPQNTIVTVPIASLSPYYGRWTIKARVTSKTDIRHWSNARGEGKLFSMDLIDESAEIRCTGFKEQCDMFYDLLEVGSIYYITKCQVKLADKRYTNIKHDFELVLNLDTAILNCEEDPSIPMIQFDFLTIDMIEAKESDSVIDVLAVVKSVSDVVELKAKSTGRDLKKRDVYLVDDSNTMVALTLWGTHAEQFNGTDNSVVAIKAVKITEFNGGRSLASLSSTIIQANPNIAEADRLLEWFHESGQARNAKLLSSPSTSSNSANCPWLTIRQAKNLKIGSPGNPNVYITKATVNLIRDKNCIYKACPTEGCKKKLSEPVNGMYLCEKCQTGFPNYVYRMIVQATIADWTGEQYITVFGDEAEKIMGMNAQKLGQLHERLTTDAYQQIFIDCAFQSFIFKIRMKQENFNDATRLKAIVSNVSPVDEKQYGSFLVNEIKTLLKKENLS